MVWFQSFLGRKFRSSRTRSAPLLPERPALPDSGIPLDSGLFGRLPLEIRQVIYGYALGGRLLHMTEKPVLGNKGCHILHTAQPVSYRYQTFGEPEPYRGVSLLQTCRQIYLDASPFLYSTNTLGISGVDNLSFFPRFARRIRGYRLEMINSIYISCQMDEYTFDRHASTSPYARRGVFIQNIWKQAWGIFATQMLGLRDLEVHLLKMHFPQLKLAVEEDWVKPMLEVRGLERFEFNLAQGIGSEESTAEYNEKLESFQKQLQNLLCSAK